MVYLKRIWNLLFCILTKLSDMLVDRLNVGMSLIEHRVIAKTVFADDVNLLNG